jgi:hypothetical protein
MGSKAGKAEDKFAMKDYHGELLAFGRVRLESVGLGRARFYSLFGRVRIDRLLVGRSCKLASQTTDTFERIFLFVSKIELEPNEVLFSFHTINQ